MDELAGQLRGLQDRVEATEAVLAIHELKARYADSVDQRFVRGQLVDDATLEHLCDEIAGTFTNDGVWDGGPVLGVARGREEITAHMRTSTLTFSRHFFVKPRIRVTGDRAEGRWDVLAPCTTRDGTCYWMTGYEDDRYVRTPDGGWLHEAMKLTTVFMAPARDGWGKIFA